MSELPVSLQGKKLPEATDCKNPEDATSRGERTGLSKKKKIIEKEGEKEKVEQQALHPMVDLSQLKSPLNDEDTKAFVKGEGESPNKFVVRKMLSLLPREEIFWCEGSNGVKVRVEQLQLQRSSEPRCSSSLSLRKIQAMCPLSHNSKR